jgi:hypothetical protein
LNLFRVGAFLNCGLNLFHDLIVEGKKEFAIMAARFGSTDANEFTLQQQNVKTKAATKCS